MKKVITFLILVFLFSPIFTQAQTKRALVIGLGEQEDTAWNKINGDKDIPYVLEYLKNANYKQIVTLVNEQATKANIVNGFKALAQSCKQNDIIYVHFSGHGQQMWDKNNDEHDEKDESWIPYDAYRRPCVKDKGEKHLSDDEVNSLLMNIRKKIGDGGKMLVVVDACHSGGATRTLENESDEIVRGVKDTFESIISFFSEEFGYINENEEPWITLSACKSDQVNIEKRNPSVGKLTYAIYTKLRSGELGDNRNFLKMIKKMVDTNKRYRQIPEMTGEIDNYNIKDILQ